MDTDNRFSQARSRLVMRVGKGSLAFAVTDPTEEHQVAFEPFTVKSGVSMAANLREAFKTSYLLLRGYAKAQVMVDAPVLLVPIEEYDEHDAPALYDHTFTGHEADLKVGSVLPTLNSVAVFSMNKDLRTVVNDHFSDVRLTPVSTPVWTHLHQRSFTGMHRKLYGYFHDQRVDVFCFAQNRFKFANSFDVAHAHDALYFLLYVWKLLGFDAEKDELHLAGETPHREWLLERLHAYLHKVYVVNAAADFNRAPVTNIKGMAYDLMTLFVKGR